MHYNPGLLELISQLSAVPRLLAYRIPRPRFDSTLSSTVHCPIETPKSYAKRRVLLGEQSNQYALAHAFFHNPHAYHAQAQTQSGYRSCERRQEQATRALARVFCAVPLAGKETSCARGSWVFSAALLIMKLDLSCARGLCFHCCHLVCTMGLVTTFRRWHRHLLTT